MWLRDSVVVAARQELPSEDLVKDGKFATRITNDPLDESEENYWAELIKNIEFTNGMQTWWTLVNV